VFVVLVLRRWWRTLDETGERMAKFTYIFRGGAFVTPGLSPTEMQAHIAKWYSWAGELAKAGHNQGRNPVQSGGTTIRGRDRVVTDGPYAESKDLVTGNMLIEAGSPAQAAELARSCPVFEYDGSVEVRPIMEREM
jgi:hypothetical protein